MFEVIERNRAKVINILRTSKIHLSKEDSCRALMFSTIEDTILSSNQEEADTTVFLHASQFLQCDCRNTVLIESPSGDTDIVVLGVSFFCANRNGFFIDNGTGQSRKILWLSGFELPNSRKRAIMGFHASTGNDYNASFFRKGKKICWKVLTKYSKFEDAFSQLSDSEDIDSNLLERLGEFVFYLYGYRETSVNRVRLRMFEKNIRSCNKVPDLSSFPPCKQVCDYHCKRANAVTYIWEQSLSATIRYPIIEENGWDPDGNIHLVDDYFPCDVEDILLNDDVEDMLNDSLQEDEYDEFIGTDEGSYTGEDVDLLL